MKKEDQNLVDKTMLRKDVAGNFRLPDSPETVPAEFLAVGPMDGRYSSTGQKLSPYFSEYALVKNRVKVEVYWLIYLLEHMRSDSDILEDFGTDRNDEIVSIYEDFSPNSFMRVKEFEKITNHDVKSVELFVAEKLKEMGMEELISYVHIGCTSEDITNTAYAKMISSALNKVWFPAAEELVDTIIRISGENLGTPMLAHTYGQPATPTTVSKELTVYSHRLSNSLEHIASLPIYAKFNGATGNYSALSVAFPYHGWMEHSQFFIEDYLELEFNPVTTQIENHDYICHILDGIRHFNNVLRDFDLDMWLYISMDYFKQLPVKSEVGSSTMPHKVNPIKFENSESNIKIGNAICSALSDELPRSRMQRDLSDSSLQRNIGLAFAYSLQAIEQTIAGLKKVAVNKEKLIEDLNNRWEVLAEPIQTVLRKYGIPDAYNQLKELTRGKEISKKDIHQFINSLDVLSDDDRLRLLDLTPMSYIGFADDIATEYTYSYNS